MTPKAPVFSPHYNFDHGDLVELHSSHPYRPERAILFRMFKDKNDENHFSVDTVMPVPNGTIALLLEDFCVIEDKVLVSVLFEESEYLAIADQLRPITNAVQIQSEVVSITGDAEVSAG